jgi:excinuclease ABC subunit C
LIPRHYEEDRRITIPKIGDKLKLLKLSEKNSAILKFESIKQEQILRPEEHKERVVNSIMKDLNLPKPAVHIECFDNSNIQGNNPVAACVVFKNGIPSKKDYRHYNIKTVVGADDYQSMFEVVQRRYSRALLEGNELPNLIVIDGGKGQLNKAIEALKTMGLDDKIPIIGLAKRLEEIIIPGDPTPLFLDKNSHTLKILMHIRDEAHRFGITHHRDKRSKGQIESILRSIPGVGPKSELKLLTNLKSISRIKAASQKELSLIVGKKVAINIIEFFESTSSKQ